MSSLRLPDRERDRDAFLPIFLANIFPLVGVLWLGWQPATLVLIYGLELLVSVLLAGGKALFAQQPPPADQEGVITVSEGPLTDKRGSVRIHDSLPPIYLRNVPFALSVILALVMYSVFFGAVVFAIFQSVGGVTDPAVLASVVALVVGQFLEAKRRYFGRRVYERVSPYAVVETPARQLFVLLFSLAFLGLALGSVGSLVLVVCLKLLVEWSSFRAERDETDANRFADGFVAWFAGPSEPTGSLDPVRAPSTDPSARVRPVRKALLLEGLLLGFWKTAFLIPFFGVLWLFIVLVVVSWLDSVFVFWLGVVASAVILLLAVGIQAAKHYLEYGTLEYRRRGDYLVAYDRLLEEPQWAESVVRLRNVSLVSDRFVDRLLGTRTIRVTTGIRSTETERRLGPVDEPDRLVDVFELPLATTDLEPINRPLAIGAGVLAARIVLAAIALIAVPGIPLETRFNGLVVPLFCSLVPWKLWTWACPDGD
ncbi:hypothetical protein GS429_05400 [Natronorubrum sp. JWXQ-INN-674]|uniref:Uncharacterized protein n=1 Tax=Natronorubrum halalkaliphilum TaxID=2691917 RepID=A0A6B0VIX3_9EURY|nr:DUF6498-containing protein [Natronorubrum halalkaliphilum]MXV61508.1 hypothetical protein [Natronorubrum halalkaliphilum]